MASVVTELLNSAGVLSKEDIPSRLKSLMKKVEDMKYMVHDISNSQYSDFVAKYTSVEKIAGNLLSAQHDYDMLYDHIEKEIKPQMNSSVAEYQEMFNDLKNIDKIKEAISNLVEMHKLLEQSKSAISTKSYLAAAESLLQFETRFKSISPEEQREIKIYGALKTSHIVTKESVIFDILKVWKKFVHIDQPEQCKKLNQTHLTVSKEINEELIDLLIALDKLKQLDFALTSFGKQFLHLIIEPLITINTEFEVVHSNKISIIKISQVDENSLPLLENVFQHLINLFSTLAVAFCELPLDKSTNSEPKTLMMQFGKLISADFCDLLVKKCLTPAVPSQSEQLASFQKDIHLVSDLQDQLFELGFFNTTENSLMDFIGKVDDLPANKMALDLLSQARELMKQDFYPTVVVGAGSSSLLDETAQDQTAELNQSVKVKNVLSSSSFAFPTCQISCSAKSLVKLLHKVMLEAKNLAAQSQTYSLKLYYTARNICELYICVVPTYHKNEIDTIPQQTAIHHNNCMYIAHCLLTLGVQYKPQYSFPTTFVDLVPEMRTLGTEALLAQMRIQRQHILQLIQDSEAFQNGAEQESVANNGEKAIRQCLQQLELLKRVWSNVLPVKVYYKAISTLLNSLLEEIILHVCSMEDIAAQSATQFDSIFDILLKQSPALFKVDKDNAQHKIHKYVKKWLKFHELQLVMVASLREIVDRWSSGQGPLASYFTANEVKQLIRALFQNTERRAAALGKIRPK